MEREDMSGFKLFNLQDMDSISEADEFFKDHKIVKWDLGYDRNYLVVQYDDYYVSVDDADIKILEAKHSTVAQKVQTKTTKIKLNKKIEELEGKLANLSVMLGEHPPQPKPQIPPKICGFCNAPLPTNKEDQAIHLDGECIK